MHYGNTSICPKQSPTKIGTIPGLSPAGTIACTFRRFFFLLKDAFLHVSGPKSIREYISKSSSPLIFNTTLLGLNNFDACIFLCLMVSAYAPMHSVVSGYPASNASYFKAKET